MKNTAILFLCLIAMRAWGQPEPANLIPRPVSVTWMAGTFILDAQTTITYNNDQASPVAGMLAEKLNRSTGFNLTTRKGTGGKIAFVLLNTANAAIGSEGYTLTTGTSAISIEANTPAGLFYGLQTLLQLLPPEIESEQVVQADWKVPAVNITDYPRLGWRGLMLDVSRHFFSKAEVKRYIDEMSRYKFNTFHWHLTDDNGWRIEIKSLPRLTEVGAWRVERNGRFGERANPKPGEPDTYGGFYTHEDIREIVAYAEERHITIVPEIDVPGHSMAAIAAYPELSCTKDKDTRVNPGTRFSEWYGDGKFKMLIDNTLNPSDEQVYVFLDKVFTEVAELFPNAYIHVGGDECYKGYWEKDPGCQALMKKENLSHVEQLQGYFMGRVEKILQSKGKKLLGWDEILEGGISPGATVMSWRGMAGGIEAAEMGHDVVMTPTTYAYIDYNQGEPTVDPPIYANLRLKKTYSFEPVPEGVEARHILGGQGNLWTEQIPTIRYAEYMTYPRAWALAEVFWTPAEKKDWVDFVGRVERQFGRSDIAGRNYSRAIFDAIVDARMENGKLWLEMEPEATNLEIRYTFDDTMPDRFSNLYTQPVEVPEGPVTLRVKTFRNGKEMGHLIVLKRDALKARAR